MSRQSSPHTRRDEIDAEFLENVKQKGILQPLLISQKDIIISGHRRWRAAKSAFINTVPVTLFRSTDELDILEALIDSNRQREKTNEEKMNEAAALEGIEKKRAEDRRLEQAKINLKQGSEPPKMKTFSSSEKTTTRDVIAKKIGVSGPTAEKALKVKKVVDNLKE